MHIEIDTLEMVVLISAWFAVQWFFRALVMVLVAKVVGAVVEKGRVQVEQVKTQVAAMGKKPESKESE